jgi:microcystin-dependent protein
MAALLTPSGRVGIVPEGLRVVSGLLEAWRYAPCGAAALWFTATPPTGWLICDGSAVSRTTYADLFAVLGTAYGVGDGTTTFNLPDLRGRFPLGKAASGTGSTLGGTGGAIDHTHDVNIAATTSGLESAAAVLTAAGAVPAAGANHTHSTDPANTTSTAANPPFMAVHFIVRT